MLAQESNVATIEANYNQAALDLEANLQLEKDGLVSTLLVKQKRGQVAELKNRLSVERSASTSAAPASSRSSRRRNPTSRSERRRRNCRRESSTI